MVWAWTQQKWATRQSTLPTCFARQRSWAGTAWHMQVGGWAGAVLGLYRASAPGLTTAAAAADFP